GLHLHLALYAVGSQHGAQEHALGQPYAAGAAVPPAALARSCAFFLGFAFSGLLCLMCFKSPASARKRCTRSEAVAPLPSQVFAFSRSSFRRSAWSLGRSGL